MCFPFISHFLEEEQNNNLSAASIFESRPITPRIRVCLIQTRTLDFAWSSANNAALLCGSHVAYVVGLNACPPITPRSCACYFNIFFFNIVYVVGFRVLVDQPTLLLQVYAGSVSPSVTLAAWESMGLEERMSAVLSASSVGTIADDVRSFASAAAAGGSGGASGDDLLER